MDHYHTDDRTTAVDAMAYLQMSGHSELAMQTVWIAEELVSLEEQAEAFDEYEILCAAELVHRAELERSTHYPM